MANNPGDLEGEPFEEIKFVTYTGQAANQIIKIECNVGVEIGSLKEDFADLFGIPAQQQKWYLKDTELGVCSTAELDNGRMLLNYDIDIDVSIGSGCQNNKRNLFLLGSIIFMTCLLSYN